MEWKIINGFPDYAVSPNGEVKSLRFNRLLKGAMNSSGYLYVNLVNKKYRKTTAIHKIVMEQFGSECPFPGAVIDHINSTKTNNKIDNLEWVSISENTKRGYGNQSKKALVLELREKKWTMQRIADHIGMSLGFVQATINGQ